ncbi:MAG: hypothetical protein EXR69_09040 [Myxococcales bacterium]|nr:hypothetical protein [Myxococcales bacterium]
MRSFPAPEPTRPRPRARVHPAGRLILLAGLALAACTDGGTGDSAAADESDDSDSVIGGTGSLALSFEMEADLIPSMENAPVGTFEGSIYAEADGTAIGPNEDAVSLEDFSAEVDLSNDGGPSGVACTTGTLDAGVVWVLGCLDVDGNGCGDEGDPITIPNENKVVIAVDVETPFTVVMSMLRP